MKIEELNEQQLKTLYNNFFVYMDKHCKGRAKMSVYEFLKKYGLNPYKAPPSCRRCF